MLSPWRFQIGSLDEGSSCRIDDLNGGQAFFHPKNINGPIWEIDGNPKVQDFCFKYSSIVVACVLIISLRFLCGFVNVLSLRDALKQSPEMCALKAALRLPSKIPFEFPGPTCWHQGNVGKTHPNRAAKKSWLSGTFFSWRLLALNAIEITKVGI